MAKPLRVLMVEDSEDDALLLLRVPKKSGFDPGAKRVQTAGQMEQALGDCAWDIILCDYNLPEFSGLDAIALLKKTSCDIPLIVVSGAIGEETAMECIHRGASDYLMKGNLTRLGLAVERELEKKELRARRKEDEAALRQSEEKYRTILESIEDGYYETDIAGRFTFFNSALCRIWGYPPEELRGLDYRVYMDEETARKVFAAHNRVYRTGMPGRLLEYDIFQKDQTRKTVQSTFTLMTDDNGNPSGFRGVIRDITELKQMEKERLESVNRLRKSLEATIHAMAVTVETRDPYTAGHQRRVADLAYAIAREMNLDENRIEGLRMASTIHDLGKISIPAEILTKPTKLTPIELEIVRTHAQSGYEILKDIDFPWPIARIVREHHERIDGSGYPQRLTENEILLESKIVMVADVVEAMASHRPYRPSLGVGPALAEIRQNRGKLYDAAIVDVCLKLFDDNRFSFAE